LVRPAGPWAVRTAPSRRQCIEGTGEMGVAADGRQSRVRGAPQPQAGTRARCIAGPGRRAPRLRQLRLLAPVRPPPVGYLLRHPTGAMTPRTDGIPHLLERRMERTA